MNRRKLKSIFFIIIEWELLLISIQFLLVRLMHIKDESGLMLVEAYSVLFSVAFLLFRLSFYKKYKNQKINFIKLAKKEKKISKKIRYMEGYKENFYYITDRIIPLLLIILTLSTLDIQLDLKVCIGSFCKYTYLLKILMIILLIMYVILNLFKYLNFERYYLFNKFYKDLSIGKDLYLVVTNLNIKFTTFSKRCTHYEKDDSTFYLLSQDVFMFLRKPLWIFNNASCIFYFIYPKDDLTLNDSLVNSIQNHYQYPHIKQVLILINGEYKNKEKIIEIYKKYPYINLFSIPSTITVYDLYQEFNRLKSKNKGLNIFITLKNLPDELIDTYYNLYNMKTVYCIFRDIISCNIQEKMHLRFFDFAELCLLIVAYISLKSNFKKIKLSTINEINFKDIMNLCYYIKVKLNCQLNYYQDIFNNSIQNLLNEKDFEEINKSFFYENKNSVTFEDICYLLKKLKDKTKNHGILVNDSLQMIFKIVLALLTIMRFNELKMEVKNDEIFISIDDQNINLSPLIVNVKEETFIYCKSDNKKSYYFNYVNNSRKEINEVYKIEGEYYERN